MHCLFDALADLFDATMELVCGVAAAVCGFVLDVAALLWHGAVEVFALLLLIGISPILLPMLLFGFIWGWTFGQLRPMEYDPGIEWSAAPPWANYAYQDSRGYWRWAIKKPEYPTNNKFNPVFNISKHRTPDGLTHWVFETRFRREGWNVRLSSVKMKRRTRLRWCARPISNTDTWWRDLDNMLEWDHPKRKHFESLAGVHSEPERFSVVAQV